jgi:hypothetical protein
MKKYMYEVTPPVITFHLNRYQIRKEIIKYYEYYTVEGSHDHPSKNIEILQEMWC